MNDILRVLQSSECILPACYCDMRTPSLVLAWRYVRNKNELAWDVCHHMPYMLFNENSRALVSFCNKYQTEPVVVGSEPCCRMLRFGNPHAFTYSGDIPLSLSDVSLLLEGDWNPHAFADCVKGLQMRMIQMMRSFEEEEMRKLDFDTIYLMYKKMEAMSITTDSAEVVQPYLNFLNAIIRMKCEMSDGRESAE